MRLANYLKMLGKKQHRKSEYKTSWKYNVVNFNVDCMFCIYIYFTSVNKSLSRQSSSIPNRPTAHASSHVSNSNPSTSTSSVILNNLRTNETEFMAKLSSCVSHMDAFENPSAQVFAQ